jgi:hypothetical protein
MAALVKHLTSFFGLARKDSGIELSNRNFPWNRLPKELLEKILDLVADPTRTAQVSRDFQASSQHAYDVLLQQYDTFPLLKGLFPESSLPLHRVKRIYFFTITSARSCDLNLETTNSPLAPHRLNEIRKLSLPRLQDKVHFYTAVFNTFSPRLTEPFDQMSQEQIIDCSETHLDVFPSLSQSFNGEMNLANLQLTHVPKKISLFSNILRLNLDNNNLISLPPEMKYLSRLFHLSLRQNPLNAETVEAVCKALPNLRTVVIDNEQPDLVKMFKKFRHLNVIVTQVIYVDEIF